MEAKQSSSKAMGIIKIKGPDGKYTKATNFAKAQWERISDEHVRDVWAADEGKLGLVLNDAHAARAVIQGLRGGEKRKAGGDGGRAAKRVRDEYDGCRVESDSDFEYI